MISVSGTETAIRPELSKFLNLREIIQMLNYAVIVGFWFGAMLPKLRLNISPLILPLLTLAVSNCGPAFTASPFSDMSASGAAGDVTEPTEAGNGGSAGLETHGPMGGTGQGGNAGTDSAGSGGLVSPSGGIGGSDGGSTTGNAGTSAGGSTEPTYPLECLRGFSTKACARVCTDQSESGCVSALACFYSKPVDQCTEFSTIALSLAQSAKRSCCP